MTGPIAPTRPSSPTPARTWTRRKRANGWKRSSAVLERDGPERAHFLLEALIEKARRSAPTCRTRRTPPTSTPFRPHQEAALARRSRAGVADPLDHPLERDGDGGARQSRARRHRRPHRQLCRPPPRSTTSASTISGTARSSHGGDLVFIQGHSAPGIYARAFLEGRLSEEQLQPLPPGGIGRAACRPIRIPG